MTGRGPGQGGVVVGWAAPGRAGLRWAGLPWRAAQRRPQEESGAWLRGSPGTAD